MGGKVGAGQQPGVWAGRGEKGKKEGITSVFNGRQEEQNRDYL